MCAVVPISPCAGRIVSGKPASELTFGEEGGSEDGEDVWTEMDTDIAGGGVDALERRGLRLYWS